MQSNVVLTGFMATGKTTVGRLLADALGFEWVDTDALIEQRHGLITEIFRTSGEEAFRDLERQLVAELAQQSGLVISTGGGLMLDEANVAVLRDARVFALTAEAEEILRRVESPDQPERPLLNGPSPAARIRHLLTERAASYARFEQVETDGLSFSEIVDDLVERLGNSERD